MINIMLRVQIMHGLDMILIETRAKGLMCLGLRD